jgi:hypothetical protein
MNMQNIQQMLANMPQRGGGPAPDNPLPDTAEKVQISSLSLLKMLKHGRNNKHINKYALKDILLNNI